MIWNKNLGGVTINLFKKLKKEPIKINLHSVAQGELIDITEVNDEVFSQKMIGNGFAVIPNDEAIYSPIEGTVTSIFPTKHAIGLKTKENIEILLHIGIDTVELKGEPFEIFVKEGDSVSPSTLLAKVDLSLLNKYNKSTDIITIITSENYANLVVNSFGPTSTSDSIGYIELN